MKIATINIWSFDNRIAIDDGFIYGFRNEIAKIASNTGRASGQVLKKTFLYSFWQILNSNPHTLAKGEN